MAQTPPRHDVIVVLGGALDPDGGLPPRVRLRMETALARYLDGYADRIIVSGKGPAGRDRPLTEAEAMKRFLQDRGVPAANILKEERSVETIGNLYFARILHLDPQGWHSPLVVTSSFHMQRVKAIAEWVLGDRYSPAFAESPDGPMTPEERARRVAQEAALLDHFQCNLVPLATPGAITRIRDCLFSDPATSAG